jgi:hypothetical protein
MALRYELADDDAVKLVDEIRAEHFPDISKAVIKVLFDLRKRKKGSGLVLGRIVKPSDLIRFFTAGNAAAIEGCDYVICLDKVVWDASGESDRVRLIRHELRHAYYDTDAKNPSFRIVPHDVQDFRAEITLNEDDPLWAERVGQLAAQVYAQRKDDRPKTHKKQGRIPGTDGKSKSAGPDA